MAFAASFTNFFIVLGDKNSICFSPTSITNHKSTSIIKKPPYRNTMIVLFFAYANIMQNQRYIANWYKYKEITDSYTCHEIMTNMIVLKTILICGINYRKSKKRFTYFQDNMEYGNKVPSSFI